MSLGVEKGWRLGDEGRFEVADQFQKSAALPKLWGCLTGWHTASSFLQFWMKNVISHARAAHIPALLEERESLCLPRL